jgi:anti-repressor protein
MIDARSLHGWLNVRQRFNDWLRERLAQYGFEEGEDFYCLSSKTGGRPRKDYLLTLDMAKELAMVERTDVGRETRRYFIRMERAALPISQDHRMTDNPPPRSDIESSP